MERSAWVLERLLIIRAACDDQGRPIILAFRRVFIPDSVKQVFCSRTDDKSHILDAGQKQVESSGHHMTRKRK